MRLLLAWLLLLGMALAGCATPQGPTDPMHCYASCSSQAGAASWAASLWVFVAVDKTGQLLRSVTVKFTDERAHTCLGGDWRKVVILGQEPKPTARFFAEPEPAYMLQGSELTINFTANICDDYTVMWGQMTATGFSGRY